MKRGPPPTPTALKLTRGNPGNRPINDSEPRPRAGIPVCPDHLTDDARAHWNQIAPDLHAAGLLTVIDGDALSAYCETWAHWIDAKRLLTEQGLIIKRPSGVAVINPAFIVAQRCAALLQRYVGEFGMTPSARSTVRLPERPTADDLEQFINTSASDVG